MDLLKNLILIIVFLVATYSFLVMFNNSDDLSNYADHWQEYDETIPESWLVTLGIGSDDDAKKKK